MKADTLHERIAKALGWTVPDTQALNLLALRDLVRPVDQSLADEITNRHRSGAILLGERE